MKDFFEGESYIYDLDGKNITEKILKIKDIEFPESFFTIKDGKKTFSIEIKRTNGEEMVMIIKNEEPN